MSSTVPLNPLDESSLLYRSTRNTPWMSILEFERQFGADRLGAAGARRRIFAEAGSRRTVEHDEDLAALRGDLHAKAWTAAVPVDSILCRRRQRIDGALSQFSLLACASLRQLIATWTQDR